MNPCLPPKIISEPKGRLDLIFLRPVLFPPLLPKQDLEFSFYWWGDEELTNIRLFSDSEDVKLIYDVCCESCSFYRYFEDTGEINIKVSIALEQNEDQVTRIPSKHSFKNKNEWQYGEKIGHFKLTDLKLNSRGEYAYESQIYDMYGKYCGYIVVMMLYTPNFNPEMRFSPTVSISSPRVKNQCQIKTPSKTPTKIPLITEENKINKFISIDNKKSNLKITKNVTASKNLPIKNRESNQAVKRKEIVHPIKNKEINPPIENKENDLTYLSDVDLQEYIPDRNFIMTRLFSFVDSGAIKASDVPILLQICQGRSPSIDLSQEQLNENYSMMLADSYIHGNCSLSNQNSLLDTQNTLSTQNNVLDTQNTLSTQNNSLRANELSQSLHNSLYLNDHNLPKKSFKTNKKISSNRLDSQNLPERIKENVKNLPIKSDDSFESDPKIHLDTSMVILRIGNLNLNPFKTNNSPVSSKNLRKKTVRQRSRICYLIEISLHFPGCSDINNSVLLVSRQVENDLVYFNANEILQLHNNGDEASLKGYLKVKAVRRKLGQRLGSEIGIGIVSLQDLFSMQDKDCLLPLSLEDDHKEQLTGTLQINTSFALKSSRNLTEFDNDEFSYTEFNIDPEVYHATTDDGNARPELLEDHVNKYLKLNLDVNLQNPHHNLCNKNDDCRLDLSRNSKDLELSNVRKNLSNYFTDCRDNYSQNDILYQEENPRIITSAKSNQGNIPRIITSNKHHSEDIPRTDSKQQHKEDTPKIGSTQQHDKDIPITESKQDHEEDLRNISMNKHFSDYEKFSHKTSKDQIPLYADFYTPSKICQDDQCKIHLEILEGHDFPMLSLTQQGESFAPNTYVRVYFPTINFETNTIENSTNPKWNFEADLTLNFQELVQMNYEMLFLVFHCVRCCKKSQDDLVLGFSTLNTEFLQNSFISLCGWIPVLNRSKVVCGELKVSLTPLKKEGFLIQREDTSTQTGHSLINFYPEIPSSMHSQMIYRTTDQHDDYTLYIENAQVHGVNNDGQQCEFPLIRSSLSGITNENKRSQNKKPIRDSLLTNENINPPIRCSDEILSQSLVNQKSNSQVVNESCKVGGLPIIDDRTFIISRAPDHYYEQESNNVEYIEKEQEIPKQQCLQTEETQNTKSPQQSMQASYDREIVSIAQESIHNPSNSPTCHVETFVWMNQTLDTPCVSYIETGGGHDGLKKPQGENLTPISENEPIPNAKKKPRKCRIAANFNFPS